MAGQGRTVERILDRLATREHGVVTRRALLDAGVTEDQVDDRIEKGLLIVEFRGVYRVGHRAPSLEARYMAAVRACGDGAVLFRRAGGHLFGLLRGGAPALEVLAPTERRIEGVTTKRSRRIEPRDVTRYKQIPVTTVPRTLVDLAAVLSLEDLARACHEAGVRYDTTPRDVDRVLARRPRSPGAANLMRVLYGDAHVTLSALERAFLRILRDAGLPLPVTNKVAGGRRVDCRWPDHHLTVELNGYRYHRSRHAWEQDHQRRREAHARGDEFRTYTYADVFEDPSFMLAELGGLLQASSPRQVA